MNTSLLNHWGPGQLFAFSALDGATDYEYGLVARTGLDPGILRIELPAQLALRLGAGPSRPTLTSDVIVGEDFRAVLIDAHHLLVEGKCEFLTQVPPELTVVQKGGRTLIASARFIHRDAVMADIDREVDARLDWLSRQLGQFDGGAAYRKAVSIMKSQVCTGEGIIKRLWTTPDRWPHRQMWLWDSAFHAIGWRHLDPAIARETLMAVFDGQTADGFIPHMASLSSRSDLTQPPVLALGAGLVDEVSPDKEWLAEIYPALCRYVEWDFAHRDRDRNGLCEWFTGPEVNNRCDESGMDNCTRFDFERALDAVDFNSYIAHECEWLARIATKLGEPEDAAKWTQKHAETCALINERLWDEELGFYFDRDIDSATAAAMPKIWAGTGFLPLLCGAVPPDRLERLLAHLRPGGKFAAAVPVPSVPASQPGYTQDMWRGPMWVNLNWLIARGLERSGCHDEAGKLLDGTLREIERWHATDGTFFEYYDDAGVLPPRQLLRKGINDPENPYRQVIHDYGWSATLYVDLKHSRVQAPRP